MRRISTVIVSVLVISQFVFSALGAAPSPERVSAKDAFNILKSLAGEWQGPIPEQSQGPAVTVRYRVTSGGTAVLETLFPGTDHEMLTVYYLEGPKLVLTHYCAVGNQPRMVLSKKSTAQDLQFDFAGGANINPKKDNHMHSARIRVDGPNTIVAEWAGYQDGKPAEPHRFTLTRKT